MLSLKQIQNVCLAFNGNSKRCRYLARDEIDPTKWYCLKKSSKKTEIDDSVTDLIKDYKKKGNDPKKAGIPLGDNCDGYPILKHIEQGL